MGVVRARKRATGVWGVGGEAGCVLYKACVTGTPVKCDSEETQRRTLLQQTGHRRGLVQETLLGVDCTNGGRCVL